MKNWMEWSLTLISAFIFILGVNADNWIIGVIGFGFMILTFNWCLSVGLNKK